MNQTGITKPKQLFFYWLWLRYLAIALTHNVLVISTTYPEILCYLANSWPKSAKALNSSAFPEGSKKNRVDCSPASPLNRV